MRINKTFRFRKEYANNLRWHVASLMEDCMIIYELYYQKENRKYSTVGYYLNEKNAQSHANRLKLEKPECDFRIIRHYTMDNNGFRNFNLIN